MLVFVLALVAGSWAPASWTIFKGSCLYRGSECEFFGVDDVTQKEFVWRSVVSNSSGIEQAEWSLVDSPGDVLELTSIALPAPQSLGSQALLLAAFNISAGRGIYAGASGGLGGAAIANMMPNGDLFNFTATLTGAIVLP
jgi:hypothetical protein